jgi:hypothetical protein
LPAIELAAAARGRTVDECERHREREETKIDRAVAWFVVKWSGENEGSTQTKEKRERSHYSLAFDEATRVCIRARETMYKYANSRPMQRGGGTREGKDEAARDKTAQGYLAEQHTDGVHNEGHNAGKSGFELRCRMEGLVSEATARAGVNMYFSDASV